MKLSNRILFFAFIFLTANVSWAENLLDVYQLAIESDPVSKSSQIQVLISESQQQQSEAMFYPNVSLSGALSKNKLSSSGSEDIDYSGKTVNLNINQTLLDLNSYYQNEQKKLVSEAVKFEYQQAQNELISKVVERYLDVLMAKDEIDFVRQREKTVQENLKQIKALYRKQLVTIVGVYEAKSELDLINSDRITADVKLSIAYERLYEIIQKRITKVAPLKINLEFDLPEDNIENWISLALSQSPKLAATQSQLKSVQEEIKSRKSQYTPTVSLSLSQSYQDIGTDYTPRPEQNISNIQLKISQQLYHYGISAHKRESVHRLSLIEQSEIELERKIEQQIREYYLKITSDVLNIKTYTNQVDSATKRVDAVKSNFKYGAVTAKEVLEADTAFFKAKLELIRAKYSYIKNQFYLKSTAGVLTEKDVHHLNAMIH